MNLLTGYREFLYKYYETYITKIANDFDRVTWRQTLVIYDIELYVWDFWHDIDIECSRIEDKLGIL